MNPFEGYRVTSPFGWRIHPVKKTRTFHTGIDLVKPHQAPIYAFTAGTVVFAAEGKSGSGFGGYGIVVAVRDKNNRLHVYAHLDSSVVKVGTKVDKGQMVGRQGNTGISTGSHLHYEIRKTAPNSPPFGWIADRENNCFEPTQYLREFYIGSRPVIGTAIVTATALNLRLGKGTQFGVVRSLKLNDKVNVYAVEGDWLDIGEGFISKGYVNLKLNTPQVTTKTQVQITTESVDVLVKAGIITSPDFWKANAIAGKTIGGESAHHLVRKMAEYIEGGGK